MIPHPHNLYSLRHTPHDPTPSSYNLSFTKSIRICVNNLCNASYSSTSLPSTLLPLTHYSSTIIYVNNLFTHLISTLLHVRLRNNPLSSLLYPHSLLPTLTPLSLLPTPYSPLLYPYSLPPLPIRSE